MSPRICPATTPTPTPMSQTTLRLSSPSFLETVLTSNGLPVYSTETYENTTSLLRCDPYHGISLVASIQWPTCASTKGKGKEFPPASILINGSSISEDDLLKRNFVNTSRKFRLPGHSVSFKWRRVQGVFQCVSSTGTPVAIFEPAILTARARITVYVNAATTFSGVDTTVSSLLTDYIIVTALILTTHPQDWHAFRRSSQPVQRELPVLDISAASPISLLSSSSSTTVSSSPTTLLPTSPSSSIPTYPYANRPYTAHSHSQSLPSSGWEYQRQQQQPSEETYRPQLRHAASLEFNPFAYSADKHLEHMEEMEQESPPPYEEIQWTVRVRQPRRGYY